MTKRRKRYHRKKKRDPNAAHREEIERIVSQQPVDVDQLRALAHTGFVSDELRKVVWPLLLGLKTVDRTLPLLPNTLESNPHRYFDQVVKDVARSMGCYDTTSKYTTRQREAQRQRLSRLVHTFFNTHPTFHYIQGFHDVFSVFLLVCGDDLALAYAMGEKLSEVHIRDSLNPNLDLVICALDLIFPLLEQADPELHSFLQSTGVQSFFILSWVLTWFAHDLFHLRDVARVFDFLLAHHPLMVLYLSAALILQMRKQVLELEEQEYSEVHFLFQRLPHELDIGKMCVAAKDLFERFPPSYLQNLTTLPSLTESRLFSPQTIKELITPHTNWAQRFVAAVFSSSKRHGAKQGGTNTNPGLGQGLQFVLPVAVACAVACYWLYTKRAF
mmetsp:Transcript_29834/g.58434  ORF Transcript_29834/g.58434 Transcript_29834/m.58434 type:complete len:386 (+) Transcript_29834:56-1213(+)